jgi:ABC-2 type transport system permease protein
MSQRFWPIATGIAVRQLSKFARTANFIPPLLIPCLFLAAFAGGLSAVSTSAKFGYPNYTAFVWVFVLVMGAVFSGIFSSVAFTDDLEDRFIRRIMLATPGRAPIIVGLVMASFLQAIFIVLFLFGAGLIAGMEATGSAPQLAVVLVIGLLLNVAVSLWGIGVALRVRSALAAPLMLLPAFAVIFTSPVYVPRHLLGGWLHTVSNVNPLTPLLEAGRGFLIGVPFHTGLAFGTVLAMIALFYVFAWTGMQKLAREP